MSLTEYFRAVYMCASREKWSPKQWKRLIETFPFSQEEKTEMFEASQFPITYNRTGLVVFKHIYPLETCREFVDEFWEYFLSLPYKPSIKAEITRVIDDLNIREDPWQTVTKKKLATLRKYYPMTGGFGGLTLPPAFHMKGSWKARQDPVIVAVYKKLLGVAEIEAYIDRVSFKFPGQGETEFAHWDSNPWTWPEEHYEGLQGILALSTTSFRGAPETHTESFRREFISKYKKGTRRDQYHIGTGKDDPMKLRDRVQTYDLNIGDIVVWSNRLLHEARLNKTDRIRYAMYINYYPAGNPSRNMLETYNSAGVDWRQDRRRSYETGKNPLAYPSGTVIRMYSMRAWTTQAKTLKTFCDMWEEDSSPCTDRVYQSGNSAGKGFPIVSGWDPIELGIYTPPPLTEEGEQLLGV